MTPDTQTCPCCEHSTAPFGRVIVLGKYDVAYYRCVNCGFVHTERPYWLDEAYSSPLQRADVGAVNRNLLFAGITQAVLQWAFSSDARYLDYGGGHGLFVRLMRDRGFDFRWSDAFATNDYALGFEADLSDRGFTLVTAFEVFEHLVDPFSEVAKMLARGRSVLFSTELLPKSAPRPGEWWYYVPNGGQHVSIYTLEALAALGRRLGASLVSNGSSLHLLSLEEPPITEPVFRYVTRARLAAVLNRLKRRPSLIPQDFASMTDDSRSDPFA